MKNDGADAGKSGGIHSVQHRRKGKGCSGKIIKRSISRETTLTDLDPGVSPYTVMRPSPFKHTQVPIMDPHAQKSSYMKKETVLPL